MYLQIAAAAGVKGSLENHCKEVSCHPWRDSALGVDEVVVLLTIMTLHDTQMAQIIQCNKRVVLIGQRGFEWRKKKNAKCLRAAALLVWNDKFYVKHHVKEILLSLLTLSVCLFQVMHNINMSMNKDYTVAVNYRLWKVNNNMSMTLCLSNEYSMCWF